MFLNNSINHEYTSLNNSYNDVESKIWRFLNAEANHSQSLNKSMNLNQSLQLVDNSAKSKLFPLKCFRKSNPKLGISSSKRYSVNTESTSPSIRRLRASASIYNTSRDRFDPLTRIRENLSMILELCIILNWAYYLKNKNFKSYFLTYLPKIWPKYAIIWSLL